MREQIAKLQPRASGPAAEALAAFDKKLEALDRAPRRRRRAAVGAGRGGGRGGARLRHRRARSAARERRSGGVMNLAAGGRRPADDRSAERDRECANNGRPDHGEVGGNQGGRYGIDEYSIESGGTGGAHAHDNAGGRVAHAATSGRAVGGATGLCIRPRRRLVRSRSSRRRGKGEGAARRRRRRQHEVPLRPYGVVVRRRPRACRGRQTARRARRRPQRQGHVLQRHSPDVGGQPGDGTHATTRRRREAAAAARCARERSGPDGGAWRCRDGQSDPRSGWAVGRHALRRAGSGDAVEKIRKW